MAKGIKTGGRQKGTPNRLTFEARQILLNVLTEEYENLGDLFEALEPVQRIDAIFKLSKFALPSMDKVNTFQAEKRSLMATNPDSLIEFQEVEEMRSKLEVEVRRRALRL